MLMRDKLAKFLLAAIFLQFVILPPAQFAQDNNGKKPQIKLAGGFPQTRTQGRVNNHDWLLAPHIFEQLSSAGKRAVALSTKRAANPEFENIRPSLQIMQTATTSLDVNDANDGNTRVND